MNHLIYLRAHVETGKKARKQTSKTVSEPEEWPEYAIVFDTETTLDTRQSLNFGFYPLLRNRNGKYVDCREEGCFYAGDKIPVALKQFGNRNRAETSEDCPKEIQVRSLHSFIEEVFFPNTLEGAVVVAFNMPFDLSRISTDVCPAQKLNEDWSFKMSDNPCYPRVIVTRKDGKIAFFRFSGIKRDPKTGRIFLDPKTGRPIKVEPGRFLDMHTLAWSLTNTSYTLKSLAHDLKKRGYKIPQKQEHKLTGRITPKELDYCRQDVRVTTGILNALRTELELHPINLRPDQGYSPASIAKAYLRRGMGIDLPSKKFRLPPKISGIASQAFYGARAECRIRKQDVPVVLLDFKSQYPTVNALMGLWDILKAKRLRITNATEEVRRFLGSLTLEKMFNPPFWKDLVGYALVQPDSDILPIRARYSEKDVNIGVNIFEKSDYPVWYALADLAASTILTGKPPKILKAIRIFPEGLQKGMKPTFIRGNKNSKVDPRTDDFFRSVIELRERSKQDKSLLESERDDLQYFFKILANAGAYGMFEEITPKRVPSWTKMEVFSGEHRFLSSSLTREDKGPFYFPVIASLITAAGRLQIAMLERCVKDAGGEHLFCDTDSMAIVASKRGGLVPCTTANSKTIKALTWKEVEQIVEQFQRLNPYTDRKIRILKVEKDSLKRQIYGYTISTKRYCLFRKSRGSIQIVDASSHGLGHLFMPGPRSKRRKNADKDAPPIWVEEAWDWIVRGVFKLPRKRPSWFGIPAMAEFSITTPKVAGYHALVKQQESLPYSERIKPFNFVLAAELDPFSLPADAEPNHFRLIAPFSDKPANWFKTDWTDIYSGRRYGLNPEFDELSGLSREVVASLLKDVMRRYQDHPEAKFLAPDGSPCNENTEGLLQRTPVTACGKPQFIGPESSRRWEQDVDIGFLSGSDDLPEYQPNETALVSSNANLRQRILNSGVSKLALAKGTSLSRQTIHDFLNDKRTYKSTQAIIFKALEKIEQEQREQKYKREEESGGEHKE